MRWLEEMWDAQKFDIPGSAEREEKRTEEVLLEMLRGLGDLAKQQVEAPHFPPWETD